MVARAVALGTCTLLVAIGCGTGGSGDTTQAAPPDQQVLRINDGVEPNSFDPTQQTYSYEAALGRRTFESLLLPKPDLSDVQPAAASSYDVSADGLTYTFHLRQEARWSDGKPVTAQDWVYGLRHLLNPALAAGYVDPFFDGTIAGGQTYADVDVKSAADIDAFLNGLGLAAPDAHTLVIKLQRPAAYFKWVATLWVAAPLRKDIVEQAAGGPFPSSDATKAEMWANDPKTLVGNGMFKLSEIVPKDHATVVANPQYWGGSPKLQRIVYSYISDANTWFAKFRTGDMDFLNVSTDNVETVRNDPKLSKEAKLYPRLGTGWMTYNVSKRPLDNPNVRLALAKSIDREKLTTNVEHGTSIPAQTFIPKGMPGYDPSLGDAQKFDPAAAKKLLQDAGVTAAQLGQLKLLTRNSTANTTINQFISAQWQQNLGVNIQLELLDSKTVTSRVRKGDYDIYGPDGWIADYPDDQDWFDIFESSACHTLNFGCPPLPAYDALVQQADSSRSESERASLYTKAQKQLLDAGAIGMLDQAGEYNVIQPWVKGLKITPMDDQYIPGDLFYHDVYVTKH
ncbi:MAG TPA: peptide ABC transporter substrate-binding protein [Candidatus Dormibacteraeota bacterium]|nr:peptide ABC transporter substrate-binding protein [Candidatus Dormibacteraeota bacterium]